MNNSILALVFLMAGTLLATTALTTMVPAAYAGGDGDGNKNKAEDDSAAAIADCDKNDVERAGFDCEAVAANDIEIDEEGGGPPMVTTLTGADVEETETGETETGETGIMSNPLFNLGQNITG